MSARSRWMMAIVMGVLTVLVLAAGHRQVGYVRDEGIYFEAGRRYAEWTVRAAQNPAFAARQKPRDRAFAVNREHPALMKVAAGLSARIFARPPRNGDGNGGVLPWLSEGAAMRLPAQIVAGVGVALLFAFAASGGGVSAGLLAAGWFLAVPRVAFHAGLATFDVPVAVAALVVVLIYRRALANPRWGWALGPALGVAISIKHNAVFFVALLAVHYATTLAWAKWRCGAALSWRQWVPLPFCSLLSTLPIAWALWPWLWSHPWARLRDYIAFHRHHAWYNMEFLGQNYNLPPLPVSYPFVMTWATVPTTLLVLAVGGLVFGLVRDAKAAAPDRPLPEASWIRPLPSGWPRLEGLLWALFALFPLVLIALPGVPIFGGTKHWLTAYPFFALAAAAGWTALWRRSGWARPWLPGIAALLCLLPGLVTTVHGHPFNLSQYTPLVGGARGAAERGLNRGFWGHAVLPLLPAIEQLAHGPSGLHLHDLHPLVQRQYAREGRWPPNVRPASLSRAELGLVFHELHMTTDEVAAWNRFGENAPVRVLSLDDVPLTSLYAAKPRR